MNQKIKTTFTQKISLVLFGVFLCLILLEAGLRLGGFVFTFLQGCENNIAMKKQGYRIMCIGESTTALGGEYAYPNQLESILNSLKTGIKFTVINEDLPGTGTSGIVDCLEKNLKRYNPNMVVVMMGINDEYDNMTPYGDDKKMLGSGENIIFVDNEIKRSV
ncbi:MAG: hypothetical protein NTX47_06405 [Candidatus Omnitrophica bacterium]|nr:hypothetical protein [Candidatus Omnitrophota bacterium]